MIIFRIDFSSIFDRKIVEKILKNHSKNDEKDKSKKHVGKAKNLEKLHVFQCFLKCRWYQILKKSIQESMKKLF